MVHPAPPVQEIVRKPDTILVANLGNTVVQNLVIATDDRQILWQGDLQTDQEMSFTFLPTDAGHFVVSYGNAAEELHKGYFGANSVLLHSFTFREDGSLAQRTRRDVMVSAQ